MGWWCLFEGCEDGTGGHLGGYQDLWRHPGLLWQHGGELVDHGAVGAEEPLQARRVSRVARVARVARFPPECVAKGSCLTVGSGGGSVLV